MMVLLHPLLQVGNPLYNDYRDNNAVAEYRVEVSSSTPLYITVLYTEYITPP
jgi:hypothetical protein